MRAAEQAYWPRLLRSYRLRNGLAQRALGACVGVDQTTISRWESGADCPGLAAQRKLRDLLHGEAQSRQDMVVRLRARHAAWPTTVVRAGAIFVEINPSAAREACAPEADLRGQSIYGHFGPRADAVTEQWERTGIFSGELALTLSVNTLQNGDGEAIYIRNMDTPHFTSDGETWCVCELKRIDRGEYDRLEREFGGPMLAIPFDSLVY